MYTIKVIYMQAVNFMKETLAKFVTDFTFSSYTKRSLCILNMFYTFQKLLTVLMGQVCCWILKKTKQNKTAYSFEVESYGYISCWF